MYSNVMFRLFRVQTHVKRNWSLIVQQTALTLLLFLPLKFNKRFNKCLLYYVLLYTLHHRISVYTHNILTQNEYLYLP